jgi:isoleucyl-tRNA synthetase
LIDAALDARWERLRAIRDEVNRALETARQDKTIGTSLQAHVTLSAGADEAALLAQHEADLPMLFIVSQVTLERSSAPGVSVAVTRAGGHKCERCWRTVPDVSSGGRFAGLCGRCIDALGPDDDREVA